MNGDTHTGALKRVVVLGTCGSGKSTLARRLAQRAGCAHVELDALHHGPNWTPAPILIFRERVREKTGASAWVVDGNYIALVSDIVWPRADTIIWLDISLDVVLRRIIRRSLGRILRRTQLWGGNRETWGALFGKDSLVAWAVQSHRRHRRELPLRLAPPKLTDVSVVRLRSSDEVNRWLDSLPTRQSTS